ncbi:FmdB family zinc ribbon protein [Aurantivibrio plasticivorans]
MPLYDYKCKDHGVFHQLATMADSGKPQACPTCGVASGRIIMIPPEVLAMAPEKRKAMEKNDRARHEPHFSTTDSRAEEAEKKAFELKRSGCCGHRASGAHHRGKPQIIGAAPDQSNLKQQVIYLADGSKVFPSQRPWMISH